MEKSMCQKKSVANKERLQQKNLKEKKSQNLSENKPTAEINNHCQPQKINNRYRKKSYPIDSYRIIPFFRLTKNSNDQSTSKEGSDINFILQQRRDTFEYFEFLLGKWRTREQIPSYFTLMCTEERNRIPQYPIPQLWEDIFVNKESRTYKEGYTKAKNKYEEIKDQIPEFIKNTQTYVKEPPWGFPGGRKNDANESSEECALRETEEEMRIPKEKFHIIPDAKYEEIYQGSDGLFYSSMYYLAEVKDFVIPEKIENPTGIRKTSFSHEIGNIFCGSFDECCERLNPRRQIIMKKVMQFLQNLEQLQKI